MHKSKSEALLPSGVRSARARARTGILCFYLGLMCLACLLDILVWFEVLQFRQDFYHENVLDPFGLAPSPRCSADSRVLLDLFLLGSLMLLVRGNPQSSNPRHLRSADPAPRIAQEDRKKGFPQRWGSASTFPKSTHKLVRFLEQEPRFL